MTEKAGQPVFGDRADELLAEKIIDHSRRASQPAGTDPETSSPAKGKGACISLMPMLVLVVVLAGVLTLMGRYGRRKNPKK